MLLRSLNCSVFQPSVTVEPNFVNGLSEAACRPTFFRGVATVVMKLFNIIRPERAYFGQKVLRGALEE